MTHAVRSSTLTRSRTFASADEERRHRKQRLAAAFRLFGQFGFDEGVAGHITAAIPSGSTTSGSTRSA